MPITAEVGAVFLIEDRASAAIDRIAVNLERLSGLATQATQALAKVGVGVTGLTNLATRLSRVESSLASLGTTANRSAGAIDSAMIRVEDAAVSATTAVANLNRELAASGGFGRGGGGGGGGGGFTGGGPFPRPPAPGEGGRPAPGFINPPRPPAPGEGSRWPAPPVYRVPYEEPQQAESLLGGAAAGLTSRLTSLPNLATGFTLYEMGKQALLEDQALHQTLSQLQLPDTKQNMDQLRETMHQAAVGTVFSERATAQAGLTAASLLGYTGPGAMEEMQQIFPIAIRGAETAQRYGLGSVDENVGAEIRMAHLMRQYDPQQLGPAMDQFLNIVERTHTTPSSLEKTLSQGLPMAVAAGADPVEAMETIAFLSRAGLGARAGTSYGAVLTGVLPTGGPTNAHLGAAAPEPGGGSQNKHNAALAALHLTDASGKSTVYDEHGKFMERDFWKIIGQDALTMTPEAYQSATHAAFEQRGMRGTAVFDQELMSRFATMLAQSQGAQAQQMQNAQQTLQTLEQVWARLQDIGNTLMTSIVGPLNDLLQPLVGFLNALDGFLKVHPDLAKWITSPALAAGQAIGNQIGNLRGALPGPGAMPADPGGTLEPATGKYRFPDGSVLDLPKPGPRATHPLMPDPGSSTNPLLGPIPQAYHPGRDGGVVIQNLIIQGAPNDSDGAWTKRIMKSLSDQLNRSGAHNQDRGWGWQESPFTQGVDI